MKIYTRTGDKGETSLFGGKRVRKDDLRIEAYGTVDELNSILGVVRSMDPPSAIDAALQDVQSDLFILGADLAAPQTDSGAEVPRIKHDHVLSLERLIDKFEIPLKPLTSFILPGGSAAGSQLHVARAACRRAERSAVRLGNSEDIGGTAVIYLNRLSDLLFVMARYSNHAARVKEMKWESPPS